MRVVQISAVLIAAVSITAVPAHAQRGSAGSHGPSAPTAPITAHTPSPTSTATTKSGAKNGSGSTAKTSTAPTASTTKVTFTATPVGQKLTKNTALSSKLTTRLTAEGYTGSVYQAAYGFKNLGQFVAATNVSKNLGISFVQLKLDMTGTKVLANGTVLKEMVGPDGKITLVDPSKTTNATLSRAPTKSLGQSIQTLKKGVNATAAAETATQQADAEIGGKK